MMKRYMISKRSDQGGFSLLEVLISVLILSIGLLGMLNLQMTSLKNNHSAQLRTNATILAYNILDKIRLNKSQNYTLAMVDTPSGTTMKDVDLIAWRNDLANDLPSGSGAIDYGLNGIVNVTVHWDDSRAGGMKQQEFRVSSVP